MQTPQQHTDAPHKPAVDRLIAEMRKSYVIKLDLFDPEQRRMVFRTIGKAHATQSNAWGHRAPSSLARSVSQGEALRNADRLFGEAIAVELTRLRDECAKAAAAVSPEAEAAVRSVALPEWKAIG